jgi:hypothetical protein
MEATVSNRSILTFLIALALATGSARTLAQGGADAACPHNTVPLEIPGNNEQRAVVLKQASSCALGEKYSRAVALLSEIIERKERGRLPEGWWYVNDMTKTCTKNKM